MKKTIILIISLLLLTGCGKVNDYSKDDVSKMFASNEMMNITEQVSSFFDVTDAYLILYKDTNVSYFITEDSKTDDLYNYLKDDILLDRSGLYVEKNNDKKNYEFYSLIANEKYSVVIKAYNKVFYINGEEKNKDQVEEVLDLLDYE